MKKASDDARKDRIHNRIAVLRAERGWSRRELAQATGVNYQTIGYLERGEYNPSLELAFRICRCFGLPVEAVFAPEPFPPLPPSALLPGRATEPPAESSVDSAHHPEKGPR